MLSSSQAVSRKDVSFHKKSKPLSLKIFYIACPNFVGFTPQIFFLSSSTVVAVRSKEIACIVTLCLAIAAS